MLLDCPPTHKYDQAYKEKCQQDVRAFIELVNQHWMEYVQPINSVDLSFEDVGFCIDTEIPGREAEDCFELMRANVKTRFKE